LKYAGLAGYELEVVQSIPYEPVMVS